MKETHQEITNAINDKIIFTESPNQPMQMYYDNHEPDIEDMLLWVIESYIKMSIK